MVPLRACSEQRRREGFLRLLAERKDRAWAQFPSPLPCRRLATAIILAVVAVLVVVIMVVVPRRSSQRLATKASADALSSSSLHDRDWKGQMFTCSDCRARASVSSW